MAAILLDVDGVLHVSGAPLPGAIDAVRRLRGDGHRIRFISNSTTTSSARLAEQLRTMGFDLAPDELQTTGGVAAKTLAGKRVLALVMQGILDDLSALELIGMNADAVLVGGVDEGDEAGRVFSYLNLNRAFLEVEAGAELYCLHKNRWWQTSGGPRLDAGVFVAGLEYAADTEAVVLGKPSPAYFAAALEALDADPELTWMVGDDFEGDVVGAQRHGMKTLLVRTGKFRPDEVEAAGVTPDAIVSSIAQVPDWLDRNL
jgi:HAD superfamily hydrolase (TIGR01458 family)